jgi:hypothetical protein
MRMHGRTRRVDVVWIAAALTAGAGGAGIATASCSSPHEHRAERAVALQVAATRDPAPGAGDPSGAVPGRVARHTTP